MKCLLRTIGLGCLIAFFVTGCSQAPEIFVFDAERSRTHILGDPGAPITVVMYSDFECEFCSEFHHDVLPKLQQKYINAGLVNFEIKDFPLFTVHQYAFLAAKASRCAGEQRQYWAYTDQLFATPERLTKTHLLELAEVVDLPSIERFSACLENSGFEDIIRDSLEEGSAQDLRGIPTLFVNDVKINGVPNYENLVRVVDAEIEELL